MHVTLELLNKFIGALARHGQICLATCMLHENAEQICSATHKLHVRVLSGALVKCATCEERIMLCVKYMPGHGISKSGFN